MKQDARKAAVAAYKKRQSQAGLYALTCTPSGERWVGRATDLDTIENRLRFALRRASTPHRSLAAAAREHGEPAFAFEVLARIEDEDASPELIAALLKTRLQYWRETLGAQAI
jgi:hypothetical protein